MQKIKPMLVAGICLLVVAASNAQNSFSKIPKDFEKLTGTWLGSLTYLDYSSGKPFTMPANIDIKRTHKINEFIFSNSYPNETSANSIDTILVSPDNKFINREHVKSRRKLPNGNIEIITEATGKDGNDNKPATFKHTYTFGKTSFTNRKDVQFMGETTWINRHEYAYKRKPGT